jgi:hypothetical protein
VSNKQSKEAKRKRNKKRALLRERHGERSVHRVNVDIHHECRYIIERAQAGEGRLVVLGNLLLFSTESRDAWLLDLEDGFALCLARDGEPQPYRIVETPDTFAIEWSAKFGIDGDTFVVADNSGKVRAIHGYPTDQIAAASGRGT